jgi:putative hemolysin
MEDDGNPVIGIVVFLVLLILNGIFYGFSTAITTVNESQVEKRTKEGSRRAKWIKQVMDAPSGTLHILQIMVTLISVILGIYQGKVFGTILANQILSVDAPQFIYSLCNVFVVIGIVFLLAVFGIAVPTKIASRRPISWVFALAGIVETLTYFFLPFSYLSDKLSNAAVLLCGLNPHENPDDVTEEEIISMVREGHEQGVLQASEAEMIHKIFEFTDKEAKDIMTHRKNIIGVDGDLSIVEALEFMLEKNYSRFPVYQGDTDNITGVIHIKDSMLKSRDSRLKNKPISQIPGLVREIHFIPETRHIDLLFRTMQSEKTHMAIVVDEYGQTSGLIAMEDILEEIVGNILDEYDEDDTPIIEQKDGSYLAKGNASLEDVCQKLEIEIADEGIDTLSGFLISLFGKIPGEEEFFHIINSGYLFQVLSIENKMIQAVRITKTPPTSNSIITFQKSNPIKQS